jgi:hypothetical protein
MKRREFMTFLVNIAAFYPFVAKAQQSSRIQEPALPIQAMDKSQAIKSLTDVIESNNIELYAFQPEGTERHFIGEAVITGAALVLLTAFLSGLQSALEPRTKNWGEALGTWISDHLESLFKTPRPSLDDELDREIVTVRSLVAAAPAETRVQVVKDVQKLIESTLARKMSPEGAATIAASTSQTAIAVAERR